MNSTEILKWDGAKTVVAALLFMAASATVTFADKHASAPASKPAAPAAKPAATGAAKSGAAPGASKGPSANGPTTGGRGGGVTTSSPGRGPTTASPAGRGVTTASPAGRGATTASPAGRSAATTTASPAAKSPTTAAGSRGPTPSATGRGATPSAASHPTPNGTKTVQTRNGSQVSMRSNGKPSDVHVANRGMDIHHGLNGDRRVAVERPDHSRVVGERGGRGYVQRPYGFRGHEYGHRTYYYHGRAYDRFYRGYPYRGVYLDVYAPEYYYGPAFYGWVYNPWAAPVPYAWGWAASPWYGYYGFYFTPYTVYPTASAWLTDYLVSTSLAASYEARADAAAAAQGQNFTNAPPPAGVTPLSPQVKDQIAIEVQRQVALENAEARVSLQTGEADPASSSIQRLVTDNQPHVFVAGRGLDVVDSTGAECALSEGDALQMAGAPPAGATTATLTVLAGKGGAECRAGTRVTVQFADLQDMQNHMRETIDQGLAELQSKQGQGGLPASPASARVPPAKSALAAAAPPPEPNVAAEIKEQVTAADQAEKEALGEANGQSGPSSAGGDRGGGAPPTLGLGQSIEEVTAAVGQPVRVVDLGSKKIYVYKDMKITFTGGKVSAIE